ncbi:30S ribosomal protein THX [Endozoicomonas sp. Mp262]
MGKGDKTTFRGKINNGSHGVKRRKGKKKKGSATAQEKS